MIPMLEKLLLIGLTYKGTILIKKFIYSILLTQILISCSTPLPSVGHIHTEGGGLGISLEYIHPSSLNGLKLDVGEDDPKPGLVFQDFVHLTYKYQISKFVGGISTNIVSITPYLGVMELKKWSAIGYFSVGTPYIDSENDMSNIVGAILSYFLNTELAISYHPHFSRIVYDTPYGLVPYSEKVVFGHEVQFGYHFQNVFVGVPVKYYPGFGNFYTGMNISFWK